MLQLKESKPSNIYYSLLYNKDKGKIYVDRIITNNFCENGIQLLIPNEILNMIVKFYHIDIIKIYKMVSFKCSIMKLINKYKKICKNGDEYLFGLTIHNKLISINNNKEKLIESFSDKNIKIISQSFGEHNYIVTNKNKVYVFGNNCFGQLGYNNKLHGMNVFPSLTYTFQKCYNILVQKY